MKLIICEKPSVAMNIGKVLNVKGRKDGYLEDDNYVISWCIGHLIGMATPEVYDEKYKTWRIEDLPIIPKAYQYEVLPRVKKQYGILKKLLKRKDIDEVVNACDSGREGELIFRLVYNHTGCRKKIKRLWISSMEDKVIKEGMDNLKEGSNYENLYDSAVARQWADWLIGMNGSRLYSKLYNSNYSIGRVQTPTLAMIVKRDEEIRKFKPEKYFVVDLVGEEYSLSTKRIDDPVIAEQIKNTIPKTLTIDEIEESQKTTKPDKIYDLTKLQREANKIYGFSAKQTLDYAQSLYEKKLITYPRTDSCYLSEEMSKDSVVDLVTKLEKDIVINTDNLNGIFNSKKVSDHHGIIPTQSSIHYDMGTVPESEKKVYDLIKYKLIMACSDNLIENKTKVKALFDNMEFFASGNVVTEEGFTKYMIKDKKETILPKIHKGDEFEIKEVKISEKYTSPPKQYTEETILKAMELAGKEKIEKGIEVERVGLGTPATRASIIENLIYKKYIKRDGKKLIPTHNGIAVISVVAEELTSPEMTADWENKLAKIASGEMNREMFMNDITHLLRELIEPYRKI
ncbi:MAG: DNA topoisomerase 3 [Tissierellia bacterium]|nr:DNA topoisomerase 3 [Tissierellia bacterium]